MEGQIIPEGSAQTHVGKGKNHISCRRILWNTDENRLIYTFHPVVRNRQRAAGSRDLLRKFRAVFLHAGAHVHLNDPGTHFHRLSALFKTVPEILRHIHLVFLFFFFSIIGGTARGFIAGRSSGSSAASCHHGSHHAYSQRAPG